MDVLVVVGVGGGVVPGVVKGVVSGNVSGVVSTLSLALGVGATTGTSESVSEGVVDGEADCVAGYPDGLTPVPLGTGAVPEEAMGIVAPVPNGIEVEIVEPSDAPIVASEAPVSDASEP